MPGAPCCASFTLNDNAALVGVFSFAVLSLALVSAFVLKAHVLDLQDGLIGDPLGGLRAIHLPPLYSGDRAAEKEESEGELQGFL